MKILVVAAHSDDETLGIGGAIARYRREGHAISVQFLTDGVGSRGADGPTVSRRRTASETAGKILGFTVIEPAAFPDNQMDTVPLLDIVKVIERAKLQVQPDVVLTHFWNDLNIDHRRTFEAVITAFRPQPAERYRSILCFEVASATEWGPPGDDFRPNRYVELTQADVELAVRAYESYQDEVRPHPHARSVEAYRARRLLRGSEVGVAYAEGLIAYRVIDRLP